MCLHYLASAKAKVYFLNSAINNRASNMKEKELQYQLGTQGPTPVRNLGRFTYTEIFE